MGQPCGPLAGLEGQAWPPAPGPCDRRGALWAGGKAVLWAGSLFPGERGELGPSEPGPFHVSPPRGGVGQAVDQGGAVPLAVGPAAHHCGSVPRTPEVAPPSPALASLGALLFSVCAQEGCFFVFVFI